jgi:hypothetical protein
MRFALLNVDEDVLDLVRAIAASGEHTVTSAVDVGRFANELAVLAEHAAYDQQWEALLLEDVVDCVIVGRGGTADLRAEQIKKLVQAKVPLLIVHPAVEAIVGYEIEMIRQDVGSVIVPYAPLVWGEEVRDLANAASSNDGELGRVEQIVFQRPMRERGKAAVLAQLARDAAVIRAIVGPIKSVSAAGDLNREAVSLSVQMTSDDGCLVRWSAEPSAEDSEPSLTLIGTTGKQHHTLRAAEQHSQLLLDDLSHAMVGARHPYLAWIDACRATEIADTVPRCLARGKTIELYNEEHTEEGAFKGVMAVGGCLILMIGLLLVVFVAIMEGLKLPLYRFSLWSHWPWYIAGIFVFFLLLQLFRFVARGKMES